MRIFSESSSTTEFASIKFKCTPEYIQNTALGLHLSNIYLSDFCELLKRLGEDKSSIFLRVARKTAERLLDGDKILKLFSLEKFDLLQVSLPAKFWI